MWLGTEPGFDPGRYVRGWRKMIAGEWGAAFAATENEELAGYISVVPHEEYGWTIGMLVDESRRGRGIGRELLAAATDWARSQSIKQLHLLVFPHNHAAIALYRKSGFVEVERYERDVIRQTGDVWDVILMRKPL